MREQIYDFIRTYIQAHGYGPSVRDIMLATEARSTSTIHHHLKVLRNEGRINYQDRRARTVRITQEEE